MSVTDPMALFVARLAPVPAAGQDSHKEFGNSLRMGQILFGKVTRVEEDGGYVMDFGGGRHLLVESTSRLNPGEVLRGRVVEIGERVVIQRMPSQSPDSEQPDAARLMARLEAAGGNVAAELKAFVVQHFALFTPLVWSELLASAGRGSEASELMKAIAFIKKLGIEDPRALSEHLVNYLKRPEVWPAFGHEKVLMTDAIARGAEGVVVGEAVQQLASEIALRSEMTGELLSELLGRDISGRDSQETDGAQQGDTGHDGRDLFGGVMRWLLNAQGDEAVSHRYMVLPFAINGELVEVEMTLFDQPQERQVRDGHKERTVLVSLSTEMLGTVGLRVREIDRHLSLDFSSDSELGLAGLVAGRGALERALGDMGYWLDRVEYAKRDAKSICSGLRESVTQWTLSTDSLSVLA
jgi:hypothetical protein